MLLARVKPWLAEHCILLLFVVLQLGFWVPVHRIAPQLDVVPDVPGKEAVHALAFGDDEFYFRMLAFDIQNAGDTGGRFTSLRYYDFNKLYQWFKLLDTLDSKSNMMPAMASYYFSQTQNAADVRYVADYLYEHASRDVEHKWWWLLQGLYLAQHKLGDMDLAAKMVAPLVNPKVPAFAQQMAAVVHEQRGEMEDALSIMETIRDNADHITEADLKFMTYFVKERLGKLDELEKHDKEKKKKKEEASSPSGSAQPTPQPSE